MAKNKTPTTVAERLQDAFSNLSIAILGLDMAAINSGPIGEKYTQEIKPILDGVRQQIINANTLLHGELPEA